MSNKVAFIGKEYEIPEDFDKYLELVVKFEKMKEDLISFFVRRIKKEEPSLIDSNDPEMFGELRKQTSKVIQMLGDKEIYHLTIDELLENSGYQMYKQTNEEAGRHMVKTLAEAQHALNSGQRYAEQKAIADNVVGTGMRLWSSSPVSHMFFGAMQYSFIKSQYKSANRQYVAEVTKLGNDVMSTLRANLQNYVKNVYIPKMEIAMTMFSYWLMYKYLDELCTLGQFDSAALKFDDFKKSQGLLENLAQSKNKEAVLENAFLACPYNDAVYEKAADLGLCDNDTLITAMRYAPDNEAGKKIVDSCKVRGLNCNYKEEYERIKPFFPLLTTQMKKDEPDVVKTLFTEQYRHYENTLAKYNKLISNSGDRQRLKSFTLEILSEFEVFGKTPEEINNRIAEAVDKNINIDNYEFLCSIGYSFNISASQSLNAQLTENLSSIILPYIEECKYERNKIDTLKQEYEREVQTKNNLIQSFEQELSSLGIFAGSKKKDLRSRIDQTRVDLDNYIKTSPYKKQQDFYKKNFI